MKLKQYDNAPDNKNGFSFPRIYRPKSYLAGTFLLLFLIGGCAAHHQNYRNSVDPSMNSSEDIREAYLKKTMALREDRPYFIMYWFESARRIADSVITGPRI
jgi:hypothetical protein